MTTVFLADNENEIDSARTDSIHHVCAICMLRRPPPIQIITLLADESQIRNPYIVNGKLFATLS